MRPSHTLFKLSQLLAMVVDCVLLSPSTLCNEATIFLHQNTITPEMHGGDATKHVYTARVALLWSGDCEHASVPARVHADAHSRLASAYSVDTFLVCTGSPIDLATALSASGCRPTAIDNYTSTSASGTLGQLADRLDAMSRVFELFRRTGHGHSYDWIMHSSLDVVHVRLPSLSRVEPGYMYLPDHPPEASVQLTPQQWASPSSFAILPPPGARGCEDCAAQFMTALEDLPLVSILPDTVRPSRIISRRLRRLGLLPRLRLLTPMQLLVMDHAGNGPVPTYSGRTGTYRSFTDPAKAVCAPGRKLKVALLFSGQPRSLEGAGYLSHKWFMDNYDVDVFAHFWYAPGVRQTTSEWSTLGNVSFDGSVPSTFERLYTPRRVAYEPPLPDEYLDTLAAPFDYTVSRNTPRNTISYYTSTERTIELFEQYQRELGAAATQYDWIIRSRTDIVLGKYPNLTALEQGNMYFMDSNVSARSIRSEFITQGFAVLPGHGLSALRAAPGDVTRASALVLRPGVCQGCASTFMRIIHSIHQNRVDGIVMADEHHVFGHLWRTGLLAKTRLLGRDTPGYLMYYSRNGEGPTGKKDYRGKPALDPFEVYRAYADPYRSPW